MLMHLCCKREEPPIIRAQVATKLTQIKHGIHRQFLFVYLMRKYKPCSFPLQVFALVSRILAQTNPNLRVGDFLEKGANLIQRS